jgi:hypothetical protein
MTRPGTRWLTVATLAAAALAGPRPAPAMCLEDCGSPDGHIGIDDFLALLSQWGEVDTSCDIDGGGVGITDLLHLLGRWGPCLHFIHLHIELEGVFQECERCIYINEEKCTTTPADVVLPFTDHDGDPATPVRFHGTVTIEAVKCDVVSRICLKDEQHTLSDWWDPGTEPYAVLRAGDTDNDDDVDAADLTFLQDQMGLPPQAGGCPWDGTRDADLNCDGIVDEADEALLSGNIGQLGECLPPEGH